MSDSTDALLKAQVVGRLVDGVEMRYWLRTSNANGHKVDIVRRVSVGIFWVRFLPPMPAGTTWTTDM